MHGLATLRRLNGEKLSEEDLIAAARSAAARPVTDSDKEWARPEETKPDTI